MVAFFVVIEAREFVAFQSPLAMVGDAGGVEGAEALGERFGNRDAKLRDG